jgi:pimeloyl-ACP methyl ester carboxylesterase
MKIPISESSSAAAVASSTGVSSDPPAAADPPATFAERAAENSSDDEFLSSAMREFLRHESAAPVAAESSAISYPNLAGHATEQRAKSTPELSALSRLMAHDSPHVLRDVVEYEREERGATLNAHVYPVQLACASSRVMFATEVRRWLEIAHASSADTKRILLERSRLTDEQLIDFDLVSTVNRPAFFTCVVPEMRAVVLSIRSTKSITDLMTDYNYEPDTFLGGAAHSGMAKAARWFAANIAPRLAVMREMFPNSRLRIVGHSLGAGVASLLCLLLRTARAFHDVEAVIFAPPACISSELGAAAAMCITSIVNGDDFLPFLSPGQQTSLLSTLFSPLAALRSATPIAAEPPAATAPPTNAAGVAAAASADSSSVSYPLLEGDDSFVLLQPSPSVTPPPPAPAPDELGRLSPALSLAQLTTSTELRALQQHFEREPETDAKTRELHARRTFVVPGCIWHMRKTSACQVAIEARVPAARFSTFPRLSIDTINQHRKAAYFAMIDAIIA